MARRRSRAPPGSPRGAVIDDEIDECSRDGVDKLPVSHRSVHESDSVDEEVGVYDIEEDDSDSECDEDEGLGDSGRLAKLARDERAVRAKLQVHRGEDSDSDTSAERDETWGARRKAYYGDADQQGDEEEEEEAIRQEEVEARTQQRKKAEALEPTDFGVESSDDGSSGSGTDLEQSLEEAWQKEGVAKMPADAPVLAALLEGLKSSLLEVRSRIGPLLQEVQEGSLATVDGVSYLETKNMLLLHYCLHLLFYMLLKAEGKSVADHPVVSKLVEIRALMERIRPLDKKLRYQIEKLLTSHLLVQASSAEGDPGQFRPLPDALVPKVSEAAQTAPDGIVDSVYRPPKLNPVTMQDERTERKREKEANSRVARKSLRSRLIKDLAREVHEMPDEVKQAEMDDDANTAKQRMRLERRAAEEEDLMMRVPLTKKEMKDVKAMHRAQLTGGALLDDFADDVAGLIQATGQDPGSLSQKFGVDLTQQSLKGAGQSGDADLPVRSSLAERRTHVDNVRTKSWQDQLPSLQDQELSLKRTLEDGPPSSEDEEYAKARKIAHGKRAAKQVTYTAASLQPPLHDVQIEDGHRKISSAVDRNRGLTPHRRKDTKNPRVKGRKKFKAAVIRRKGQVVDVRKPRTSYGGEETGIRTRVSRSTRL